MQISDAAARANAGVWLGPRAHPCAPGPCARAQRALPETGSVPCRSAACRVRVGRTACDRRGMRRVGRARRGDAGLPCLANACGEGPSPKARKSCTSCTSAGAVPQPMAVIRACWADGRQARRPRGVHGARFSSRRGLCVAHGRSGGTTGRHRRQQLRAEAGCWYLFQGR